MANSEKAQLGKWENTLKHLTGLSEAERLRDNVIDPDTADANVCWGVIWNKPLYANMYVSTAERHEAAISGDMQGAWQYLGKESKKFEIVHQSLGKAEKNYVIKGTLAKKLRENPKIAVHRLFAIQGAAKGLREIVKEAGKKHPFKGLAKQPLTELIPYLKSNLVKGGGISAYFMC